MSSHLHDYIKEYCLVGCILRGQELTYTRCNATLSQFRLPEILSHLPTSSYPFLFFPYLFYPILISTLSHPIQIYAAAFTTLKLGPIPYPIPSHPILSYCILSSLFFSLGYIRIEYIRCTTFVGKIRSHLAKAQRTGLILSAAVVGTQ